MSQRVSVSKTNYGGQLWVPKRLVRLIPASARFEPELTNEGILFRFVRETARPEDLPAWARDGDE